MWNIIEHCLLPQDYQFWHLYRFISEILPFKILKWSKIQDGGVRVCGRSTLPEPIRDRAHNPCQSVDCPSCRNQSETEHSSSVAILRGFHHNQ